MPSLYFKNHFKLWKNKIKIKIKKNLLMIPYPEKEGWHYLAVKKLSSLSRGVTSKHHGNFYCLNFLHSFWTENKLVKSKSCEKVYKNKDFCGTVLPSEKDKTLEFNQYMKLDKMLYIIYADIESLVRNENGCARNPENSSTTEIGEHIPCQQSILYSMSTI